MNDVVIEVENLGKRYRIGSATERSQTFREVLTDALTHPFRRLKYFLKNQPTPSLNKPEYIWALRNVSFEVKRGEIVGIIGRNGAGKSTLLKILSRITEPTEGTVTLRGRVGSLLEVGTGFHSELTGEENIYLSGTILGMSSNEVSRKFNEIVSFAEVEKFIHTPVKYYSSGMYMRLAFAVAAHMEPDILLVDEVLAVGDTHFYNKCTNKMNERRKQGTTIFLVSHNMWLIQTLCDRVMFLDRGKILMIGDPFNTVQEYINVQSERLEEEEKIDEEERPVKMKYAEVRDINGNPLKETTPDGTVIVFATYGCRKESFEAYFFLRVTTPEGYPLYTSYSDLQTLSSGNGRIEAVIESFSLLEGEYRLWIGVCGKRKEEDRISEKQLRIEVKSPPAFPEPRFGVFFNKVIWKRN